MEDFQALAKQLSGDGVIASNMFGMPVLKLGKRPICGLDSDGINFKLPAGSNAMSRALKLDGSHLFQPTMKGRQGPVMKQWVVVPFRHSNMYLDFAHESLRFVAEQG
jgi:hypothetical protein